MDARVIGSLGGVLAVIVVWLAWPASDTPAAPAAQGTEAPRVDTTAAPLTARPSPPPADLGPTRAVQVEVVGCRNEPGAGVEVEATYADKRYAVTARAGRDGRARLAVPGEGPIEVRARVGAARFDAVEVVDGAATVTACRAARVHGRVLFEDGTPLEGWTVALLDGAGDVIAETVADVGGTYAIADPLVLGAALWVSDGYEEVARDLARLAPGEDREHDVLVGGEREVVGWVLDLHGAPQPGVVVTLRAEKTASAWVTITDAGGGFRFANAPGTPVRVDADGGELGTATGRLASSADARRELSLVLESTATITVFADAAEIAVRCHDARCHGQDGLQAVLDDSERLAEILAAGDGEHAVRYDFEGPDYVDDHGEPYTADRGRSVADEADTMMAAMEASLMTWNPDDPEGSLVAMMRSVVAVVPGGEEQLLGAVGHDRAFDVDEAMRVMVRELMDSDPDMVGMIGRAAYHVQGGTPLEEAAQRAEEEVLALREPSYAAEAPAEGEGYRDWEMDAPDDGELGAAAPAPGPPTLDPAQVAAGRPGVPLRVAGSFPYTIHVRRADGRWDDCGEVYVNPGDELVVRCDDAGAAVITGRVVDLRGAPLAGVEVTADDLYRVSATTGADGRFAFESQLGGAVVTSLRFADPSGRFAPTSRRSVPLVAGGQRDVGVVVIRTEHERPPPTFESDYGGIGGLVGLDRLGVRLIDIEDDTPLALYGIEPGDTIVQIDGAPAAELPMDELLLRLRGEPGTTVGLRVRTAAGELYEVDVLRDMVAPRRR